MTKINVGIFHSPENVSDHLPVMIDLNIILKPFESNCKQFIPHVDWRKVTGAVKMDYEKCMKSELDKIDIPHQTILHGDKCYNNTEHIFAIETYYNDTVAG